MSARCCKILICNFQLNKMKAMSNAALSKTEAQMCNGLRTGSSTILPCDAPGSPNEGFSVIRHRSPGIMDCKNSSNVVVDIIGKICTARAGAPTAVETMSFVIVISFQSFPNLIMRSCHRIITRCNLMSAICICKLFYQDIYQSRI